MTKEELKKLSDDTFFDNDTGEIQPESHRNFNNHLIDHTETVTEAARRSAKEYTDAREVAILATVDTKDETMLRTAKEYADRIVAALAGSAPETLDTLQELAAALGDDPNFSATVMQMIGERVTTETLAEALAGKFGIIGNGVNANELEQGSGYSYSGNTPTNGTVASFSGLGVIYGVLQLFCDNQESNNARFWIRNNNQQGFTPWRELYHSGNFDAANAMQWLGRGTLLNNWRAGHGFTQGDTPVEGHSSSFLSFGMSGYEVEICLGGYSSWLNGWNRIFFRSRNADDGSVSDWREFYHSGNLKPTYYAQIDPNGNVTGQVGGWIQSVAWKSDGYGMQCYILPKMAVNIATAHITKVRAGGNTFKGRAPVVCDELLDGCIIVATPGDSGASETSYFNISIQGA
ncbi:hypothetical protein [uncultured Rikenella sp.]|uniref:hypothetical protein n=1 Tax=uncultured Rikenella sp. TaxID=368003 RepID=UPI0025E7C3F1|nr:hypothetical protein [uncultured Rikenella sp.]